MDIINLSSFKDIWGDIIFPLFGYLGVAITFALGVQGLINAIPTFKRAFINLLKWWAEKTEYKVYKKLAIKADIENVVNSIAEEMRKELPKEWVKRANIIWVRKAGDLEIEDGEIIMRIRPLKDQEDNLIVATHTFFKSIIFPRTKSVIPRSISDATAFKISHRAIETQRPFLIERFERRLLEDAIQSDKNIANYFGQFSTLDSRGFFSAFFLREIDEMADSVRLDERRASIKREIDGILSHTLSFSNEIYRVGENAKEEDWVRNGFTHYGFMIIARDSAQSVDVYTKRAKKNQGLGISRLYIIGKSNRPRFTKKIIKKISKLNGFELIDTYKLSHDYKGHPGGIGAVFKVS